MGGNTVSHKSNISWIFFDVGSTLVDETEAYNHRIRDAISGTEISFEQFQEKRAFFAKQNLKGDLEALKFFGLEKTPWHTEDEVPYPEAEEVLRYLKEKGYRLGVIANQSLGTAERLSDWGLLTYFDVVAASAEFGVAKPDPAIFKRAFLLAGCLAEEAVMIGDRLDNDIVPAKKLGMKAVWVKQGFAVYQNVAAVEYKPDYEIGNLMELKDIL
ncbi:MAG: HAD-IA family hydrolase [Lachnospiraceae bacterium]|nr:HAD-IA family hydrolase [Lachnospiraceae bacterium]